MPDSLTSRLLAEIERREGNWRQPEPTNGDELGYTAREVLAYLAALRTVVEIHTGAHSCTTRSGAPLDIDHGGRCPTLLVVATALDVTP